MKAGTPGFVGLRLKNAREARGISTIGGLADLLGVTRSAVSQYESGESTPSPEILRKISETLNLPMQHFFKPLEISTDPVFFRSLKSANKSSRQRAQGNIIWLREMVYYLKNFMNFPPVEIPNFSVPEDPQCINDEDIELWANMLRKHWGLGSGPISNVVWLLENKGIVVCSFELDSEKLDAFSHWPVQDEVPLLFLSTNKASCARSRFDACHELGHLILHRNISPELLKNNEIFKLVERQAHRFSSAFLLPRESFLKSVYSIDLDILASQKMHWRISVAAMIMRAHQLNKLSDDQAKRLYINLNRRGWKKKEIYDNELELEYPRFVKRCFELLFTNEIVSPRSLPIETGLAISDIERLAGFKAQEIDKMQKVTLEPKIVKFPRIS